jgi:hypothetical protein
LNSKEGVTMADNTNLGLSSVQAVASETATRPAAVPAAAPAPSAAVIPEATGAPATAAQPIPAPAEQAVPPASPAQAPEGGEAASVEVEEEVLEILYAPNVMEDWDGLRELIDYMVKRKPHLAIFTNVLQNPLNADEQVAFRHANRYVGEAFKKDGNFSDVQLFLESFRNDPASDVVAVSARQILKLVETGKTRMGERLQTFASILGRCPCRYTIVPGRFEDLDMVRSLAPAPVPESYLSVRKVEERGIRIVGIGGLPGSSEDCPLAFQEREYFEGSSQAEEYLRDVIGEDTDILVSFSPISFFTDPGEERLVRDFISRWLPGKLILTSQSLKDYDKTLLTTSGAELIRGGSFGKGAAGTARTFWELSWGKKGLTDKSLFELKARKAFRLL